MLFAAVVITTLTFTTRWADSYRTFLFFPENRIRHFMQIVSIGKNLYKMSKPAFWE